MRNVSSLLLVAVIWTQTVWAQDDLSQVKETIVPLRAGLYLLQGAGGNIVASVGDDGVFLVDDQFAELSDKIRAALATLSDQPIRYIVNTHWHGDHTGGNENFGKEHAVIVAQDRTRQRMSEPKVLKRFPEPRPASPHVALPTLTFDDGMTVHLNGQTVELKHTPRAHTDGDALVHYLEADVLHMGDTFFAGMYPLIDIETGGSIDGVIAAANAGLELSGPQTIIVPGHGALSDRDGLRRYRDMLVDVRTRVAALMAEGKSRQQVIDAHPSAAYDVQLGGGFISPEALAGTVYDSLAATSNK